MSIIKEKIYLENKDNVIKINLKNLDNYIGNYQEVNNFINNNTGNIINGVNDYEVKRYKLKPLQFNNYQNINFYYYNYESESYSNNYLNIGFTYNEIIKQSLSFLNSFYVFDFYDTYKSTNQKKIFTSYLTQFSTKINDINSTWKIEKGVEMYNISVPSYYINNQTNPISYLYFKIYFYNAKTGSLINFYNDNNINQYSEEYQYFTIRFDHNNNEWSFYPITIDINAYQFININYNVRINNTLDKQNVVEYIFPTGNTFNYTTGNYSTL